MSEYRLEMRDMVKLFPGVKALDHAELLVKPGSIHALVGENGAGKSTLMKCLYGIYQPDEGSITLDGQPVGISDTHDAIVSGIAMIHQELNPILERNIQDNIWLGRFEIKGIVVDEKRMFQKTKELLEQLDFDISPHTYAKNLSVSELQAVEIAKAISYNAKLVIMDEPTSSLTTSETQHLFKLIRRIRESGTSVIYISHKMEEIFEIADELTIMRDGKFIGRWSTGDLTIGDVINKMVGREINDRFPPQEIAPREEDMLIVKDLTSSDPLSFKNVNFVLKKGEILGIGGLVGAQRTEMVESLFGLRPLSSGTIKKEGELIRNTSPRRAIANGFALLTEERRATGIMPMLSVQDNALVASRDKFTYPLRIIRERESGRAAREVCKKLNVKTPSLKTQIMDLSGGNQQKVLIGRWLLTDSNILILDEPTRGIDVGAKYEIYRIMRDLAAAGNSVIMVSSEMPELLGMADRVLVMCAGRVTGILPKKDVSQVEIMKLATQFS